MEDLLKFILIIGGAIGIFMAFREIICWYYKINIMIEKKDETIRNQEKIIELLEKILEK